MTTASPRMFVVECYRCGREYTPTRDQIIAGVWRKACPACYPTHLLNAHEKEHPNAEATR